MTITAISDTHTQHEKLLLLGGDLLIFSGDFMGSGYNKLEVLDFLKWLNDQTHYNDIVFIAGNHDRWVENYPDEFKDIIPQYNNITYLQDNFIIIDGVKIYGSPWQPWFYNWAFNLQRGPEIKEKWDLIPEDTDILITHGPPYGILDKCPNSVGCEDLLNRIEEIKPKINIFGHIHEGYGYISKNDTHFINASVLDEKYRQINNPLTFVWDKETNNIEFI